MARLTLALLLPALLLIGALAGGADAQDSAACPDDMLVMFSSNAEYDSACSAFMACYDAEADFIACSPHFLVERLAVCGNDDAMCVAQARLQTALISLYHGNGFEAQSLTDESWMTLATALLDADALADSSTGNSITALFTELVTHSSFDHPMPEYIRGVAAEAYGNTAMAEQIYSVVVSSTNDPLVYLTRGDLYAALGDNDKAALDYTLFATTVAAPELSDGVQAILEATAEAFPLDLSAAQPYSLYPVLHEDSGPGGSWAFDASLEPASDVMLLPVGDGLLFIQDESAQRAAGEYRLILPFYTLTARTDETLEWWGRDFYEWFFAEIQLSATDAANVYHGTRRDVVFEGTRVREFYLAPAGDSDPRPDGFRCDGAPRTYLADATNVYIRHPFETHFLYDAPGGNVVTEIAMATTPATDFTIVSGPECADGFTWYEVKSDTYSGWIQENIDATQYALGR